MPISTEIQARPPRDQTLALQSRVPGRRDSVVRVGVGGGGCGTINVPMSTEVQARPPRDQTLALLSRVRGRRDSVVRMGSGGMRNY